MKKFDFWTYGILGSGLLILIWALLKSFGIINTPVWIEMIPYYGIAFAVISAAYKIGDFSQWIKQNLKNHEKRLVKIENKIF